MKRPSHILNAASNLLGIALVIIAGLNLSHVDNRGEAIEKWADRIFLLGLATLIGSIVVLATTNG
jgi:hypothetical protein